MSAKVENLKIVDLSPQIKDPALQKYLPTRLFPQHISFELSPVSNAVSNAIRRTVACELLVARMNTGFENLTTTDMFIIPEMVLRRFEMIPIDQKCPRDAKFELIASNNSAIVRDVKASEIRIVFPGKDHKLKDLPFNGTFTICTLLPGKSIKVTDIGIRTAFGFVSGAGMYAVAVNAASIALDQKPINLYEPNGDGGIPSRISNPRKWKISFNANGDMPPKAIVVAACNNIIERVQSVQDLLFSITNNEDEYILVIPGESHTIGNLFMRTISDLFPDLHAVVYTPSNIGRTCTIRIRCDEDINTIYNTTIKHLVRLFGDIKHHFE